MTVVGRLTGGELFRGVDEQMVLQNMERRPVRRLRFFIPPLPQLAQDGARASTELTGAGNPPHFLVVARPLHGRLLQRPLTRLPEPLEPPALAQPGLQFLRQRQQVTR